MYIYEACYFSIIIVIIIIIIITGIINIIIEWMNEWRHSPGLDTWIVPGQIRKIIIECIYILIPYKANKPSITVLCIIIKE